MKLHFDWRAAAAVFIVIPLLLIFSKIFFFEYSLNTVIPQKGYKLVFTAETVNRKPIAAHIKTFAPVNNTKQQIVKEQGLSDSFTFALANEGENRRMIWQGSGISGQNKVEYQVTLKSARVKYIFNDETEMNVPVTDQLQRYLEPSEEIQSGSPAIARKALEITEGKETLYAKVRAIHEYVMNEIRYINFSGVLDAEACMLLGEGSCNGKSRLFVAMARTLGIPARVVGGIILNKSPKRTIHQWVELFINGQWVPFCPTNNYFAELPKNYITLYYDDEVLFKYSSGLDFDYSFSYEKTTLLGEDLYQKFQRLPVNIYRLMEHFEKFNLSIDVFVYLLMLPLAALVSVVLKNVIGLETFGTFLPILLASVLHNTGLIAGVSAFFLVIFVVYLVNRGITRFNLLYHPRMAILLSFVILALIGMFYFGLQFRYYNLLYVVFFPVAIVAITINRVIDLVEQANFRHLLVVSINTIIVTVISFYFIHSIFLQLMMLSFPEIVLIIIGLNIIVGRWSGFRVSEYFRFAGLIRGQA